MLEEQNAVQAKLVTPARKPPKTAAYCALGSCFVLPQGSGNTF